MFWSVCPRDHGCLTLLSTRKSKEVYVAIDPVNMIGLLAYELIELYAKHL